MDRRTVIVLGVVGSGLVLLGGVALWQNGVGLGHRTAASVNDTQEAVQVVATGLEIPWAVRFLPDGDMLVTERPGMLLRLNRERGTVTQTYQVSGVAHRGEGGLLGLALHPNYTENRFIYLYMTTQDEDMLRNRVVRYTLQNTTLADPTPIIQDLPGAPYHDGGRIQFGPDNKLYITAGDATRKSWAQNTSTYAGKILRLNADGTTPQDNPFDNAVYSYGHRNPQGLAWVNNQLWATEHGDRQHDELNKIVKGGNYGWPVIEADQTRDGMKQPVLYADGTTWAPAGATTVNNTVVFAGLRGSALYAADIRDGDVTAFKKYLDGRFGRLRAVVKGPDGDVYVSTSNRDDRFTPGPRDDKIIRVDPAVFTNQ